MKGRLITSNYRILIRLLAVLVSAMGLNLAWATWAQAAGNVELRLENGELIIKGDDADNNIIVIQDCCQTVIVNGGAYTTIIGSCGRFDVEGVNNTVVFYM